MTKKIAIIAVILFLSSTLLLLSLRNHDESFFEETDEERCTVILAGKKATVDGSVITSQTADCSMCDITWHFVPAASYDPDAARKIYHISQYKTWPPETGGKWLMIQEQETGTEIPQVKHTYAYMKGIFGHMNEHQLGISESTFTGKDKLANNTPSAVMDITTLTLIAMERCKTARDAIQTMGLLAEQYGYGYHDQGEMLAVSDPNEVWIFEIIPVGPLWTPDSGQPGAAWCAQRVPDNHVSFCPNESRIGEIDLDDPEYFMASSNVESLAVEKGLYDPDSGEPFNWKKAYDPREESADSSHGRRARLWRLFDLVAPSLELDPNTPNMDLPFSVKPDKKLSMKDIMALNRDKYKGARFDPTSGIKGGPFANPHYFQSFKFQENSYATPRLVSIPTSEYTVINQTRDWLPDPIGGIMWLALGTQDTSCFIPFYAGVTSIPVSFSIGDHWIFNRESARWAFDYVDFHTQVVYSYAIEDVRNSQEKWESIALERIDAWDKKIKNLYKKNSQKALQLLTESCLGHAQDVVNAWWELGDDLLVKYNHFRIYDAQTRTAERIKPSEAWMKALVEYEKLKSR